MAPERTSWEWSPVCGKTGEKEGEERWGNPTSRTTAEVFMAHGRVQTIILGGLEEVMY